MGGMIYSVLLIPTAPMPAPQAWRFDIWSALIGAVLTLILVGLAYRFRDRLRQGWEGAAVPLIQLRHHLLASAEEAYRELVVKRARSFIIPGHVAPLDALFVEPDLVVPSFPSQSVSEVEGMRMGRQLLPLSQILAGHSRLLLVGGSGMGKTASLAYLALSSAVSAKTKGADPAKVAALPQAVRGWLPLYLSLAAMDWGVEDEDEGELEVEGEPEQEPEQKAQQRQKKSEKPVDRLVNAAIAAIGGGGGFTRPIRQYLKAGQAIVLADGWRQLLPEQRQQAAQWLAELADDLPRNVWLVAVEARDYALLTEIGFVPLILSPWDAGQVEAFAQRWVEAFASSDGAPSVSTRELAPRLQREARAGGSSLELALRAYVYLSDGQPPPAGRVALFDRTLELLLWQEQELEEMPWFLSACRTTLGRVALELQQEERVTVAREEIEAAIEAALPLPEERPARAAARVLRALTGERGVLHSVGSDCYAFTHPLWQAYLAARQLVATDPETLVERLEDPHWAEVFRFYVELGEARPLVSAWVHAGDDMFCTRLRALGSWIRAAPQDAAWRDGAMAVLARSFLQPTQPAPTRRMLAEVLATTGARGITYFLKQALEHEDPGVRSAAILGLAKVAGEKEMPAFEKALSDEDQTVREAAVRGLAYLRIDASTRRLERVLVEGDGALRPVAAQVLAKCGEEGVDFLYDVIESGDVMTRRAAVSGLAELGAREVLERVAREDEQWIVHSAASSAVEELERREKTSGIAPPPQIEQLPWLISWAAAQGEGVGLGDAARRMLGRALNEGDVSVRLAAARVLIQVGRPEDVEPLRVALSDPEPIVVDAALEALAEIGRRYGLRIKREG